MAVQIGVQGYQLGPPPQFMQPPPHLANPSVVPIVNFAVPHQMPPVVEPAMVQPRLPSSSASPLRMAGANNAMMVPGGMLSGGSFDGRRMRSKSTQRRTVDYNASLVNYVQNRIWQRDSRDMRALQPDALYNHLLVPPAMMLDVPVNAITTRSVRTATNKIKCPVFCTCWTPEGRRLVTGASSGEFTLWNGLTFSFETILQAHDTAVRSMIWSHNDQWMLTGDHGGFVKYWQSNMNNVKMYQAHKDPVRGLSFCPTDQKYASCSDDGTVRIWDFFRCYEEKILRGHGADVKCVDWHPHKSLIASGSKDTQQPVKLWDPRSGSHLATVHAHKHTVMDLKWNKNGNWLLTASRDHLLKLFDVRNMKEEMQSFRGHKKEATTVAWHPIHECLFTSGGSDGAIMFWLTSNDKEIGSIDEAHETMVWSLSWHPLGHVLVSGSNDHTTKFWTRNRLGDSMRDRYNLNNLPFGVTEDLFDDVEHQTSVTVPGLDNSLESSKKSEEAVKSVETESAGPSIPGLDFSQPKLDIPIDANCDGSSADARASAAAAAARRKAIYTKPVPKAFERAWAEGRQPAGIAATGPPEPGSESGPLPGLHGDIAGDGRPPLPPQPLGPGRWSGPPPPRSSNPLPAPGKILSAQLNAAASDPLRHPSMRPPPLPPGINQPNAIRAPLRQPAPVRPLMSVPQGHQPDGWQQPQGPLDDEEQHFDEYGEGDNFGDFGDQLPHGDVDYRSAGPGPGPGPGPETGFSLGPGVGQGPRLGPGPGPEHGPGPRPGLGMGPRGPLRAPGFRPGAPRGENIGGGGGQFGRRPPPAMRQPDQEGPPHSEFEFEPLGPPPRIGGIGGGGGGPPKPPSLLDIPVRPAVPGGGLKRKWEPEPGGLHDTFDTFETRLGGDGPPDGGQFGQMPPEMMNRGPLPPPPQPTPLMDDELMEGPPGGHLGRGRGFFRGGPFHAGGPVRGRGGMRGGLGR